MTSHKELEVPPRGKNGNRDDGLSLRTTGVPFWVRDTGVSGLGGEGGTGGRI